jgi:polyhydroxybutyrate depolymerase
MPRRRSTLLVIALVATFALAACASDGGNSSARGEPEAAVSATAGATVSTAENDPTSVSSVPSPTESSEPTGATDPTDPTEPAQVDPAPVDAEALVADRPVEVVVPEGLSDDPAPLVLVLHGYSGTGATQRQYFDFEGEAAARGFLLVYPDGTTDLRGDQFWNATDACCNFNGSTVDDVAYLTAVIDHVAGIHAVDPDRIYLAGHSNGGFMSYRMACERADLIAAVVSLAGATFADPGDCRPTEPVSVAQVHGTDDSVIVYDGGSIVGTPYPSAATTAATWAAYNGCDTSIVPGDDELDLVPSIDPDGSGDDTSVAVFTGCPNDGDVELLTIAGGGHIPDLSSTFVTTVFDFFDAHPKG